MELTRRQQEILTYIEECMLQHGMPPTRAEIVDHFNFASPNAAQCHLRALAERGAIELRPGIARGIVPQRLSAQGAPRMGSRRVPIIGRVAAGTPLLAVENLEDEMDIDAGLFRPRPHYALRVFGNSMIGAGIHDGDLLMVHRTPDAQSGQIVVARINDEVTVKRLRRRGRGIFLDPENSRHKPIHVTADDDFALEGLGVGVVRVALA